LELLHDHLEEKQIQLEEQIQKHDQMQELSDTLDAAKTECTSVRSQLQKQEHQHQLLAVEQETAAFWLRQTIDQLQQQIEEYEQRLGQNGGPASPSESGLLSDSWFQVALRLEDAFLRLYDVVCLIPILFVSVFTSFLQ
jgi:hypothetical protein